MTDRKRVELGGTALFSMFQAALIVGLLVNRVKRQRGEAEATLIADISWKFVNLPPNQVEREIMDAERRICEFLGLDLAALWQWSDKAPASLMLTHHSLIIGPTPRAWPDHRAEAVTY